MLQTTINKLVEEFGPVEWYPYNLSDNFKGGWFLLEANPLPPYEQIVNVISDIHNSKQNKSFPVNVTNGKLHHSINCTAKNHKIPTYLLRATDLLQDQKFLVAVHPGNPFYFGGQPIAIAFDPEISYRVYPDHPHLSTFFNNKELKYELDMLCYTDDPSGLGETAFDIMIEAFGQICIWLFRHQVWLATRQLGQPTWIGLNGPRRKAETYADLINPFGSCRCGGKEHYSECCMTGDIAKKEKLSHKEASKKLNLYINRWPRQVGLPQQEEINNFRKKFQVPSK